jgi:hypothetical protein
MMLGSIRRASGRTRKGMVIIGDCGPSDTHGLAMAGHTRTLVVYEQ